MGLTVDGSGCNEVCGLIPWVANGTAVPGDRALVYLHTTACSDCRRDLARALALASRVDRVARALPAVPPAVWERLADRFQSGEDEARRLRSTVEAQPPVTEAGPLLRRTLPWLEEAGVPTAVTTRVRWALDAALQPVAQALAPLPGRVLLSRFASGIG